MKPRIVHIIWCSRCGRPFPTYCLQFIGKWSILNPGLLVKIWGRDELLSEFPETFPSLWDQCGDEAQITNRMRFEIAFRYGGIYADVDTEPLKAFAPLLDSSDRFIIGEIWNPRGPNYLIEVEANIFICEKDSLVAKACIDYHQSIYEKSGNYLRCGRIINHVLQETPNELTVVPEYFFQSNFPDKRAFSSHWNHPLRSWR